MSANNNNTTNNPPSTLKSYVDSAVGATQNLAGSLIGNRNDEVGIPSTPLPYSYTFYQLANISTKKQAEGQAKQRKAQAEHDASHATAKLPGATASSTGAITKDDPNRSAGSWNQTAGSAKEFVGGLVGNEVSIRREDEIP